MKSKIHRVKITQAELHYAGGITVDEDLMDAADIVENEKVQVVNINNVKPLETYIIKEDCGSGEVCLNRPTARLAQDVDLEILIPYGLAQKDVAKSNSPALVLTDETNKIIF